MAKTVNKITEEYLKANKFDGLVNHGQCACEVGDLFPCTEDDPHECEAGHKKRCKDCPDIADCEIRSEFECTWCMS